MEKLLALIIEDQRDNIVLFQDVLQLANCHTESVRDGLAAIEWLKANKAPHLIILDLNLPYLDGIEVYRYIRQQARFDATQIIATTANIRLADKLKKELIVTDSILHKPVNITEILRLVNELSITISKELA